MIIRPPIPNPNPRLFQGRGSGKGHEKSFSIKNNTFNYYDMRRSADFDIMYGIQTDSEFRPVVLLCVESFVVIAM